MLKLVQDWKYPTQATWSSVKQCPTIAQLQICTCLSGYDPLSNLQETHHVLGNHWLYHADFSLK